ncbi:hypothetical protein C1149_03415 [Clostridium botulinum]|nr:hypothetical protein C1149_03415 [Clostridium botulinum]
MEDNYSIYRIRVDGLDMKKINNYSSRNFMRIKDGWIYYINEELGNNLYRTTLDGNYEEKLNNDSCVNAIMDNTSIYYGKDIDSNKTHLYKINIDGLERKKYVKKIVQDPWLLQEITYISQETIRKEYIK